MSCNSGSTGLSADAVNRETATGSVMTARQSSLTAWLKRKNEVDEEYQAEEVVVKEVDYTVYNRRLKQR